MHPGKVYLIGAGPGDPELITARGITALSEADVVLYDALAHPALLEHAPPHAELRSVGKRYGEESFSQQAINDELVALARAGKVVARLKGGDPFFFARGSEEAETLARAGIPFEIVPGILSPIGAAAYAGISLTHRDLSSSVAIITGTESPGKERTAHDWSKLATATQTLCVIMGMRRLAEITRALVEHGRSPDTPAAVIQWGTWPRQRVVEGTLETIAERVKSSNISNPGVIIVGEVVRLRDELRWFDRRPLFGKLIALTRPIEQARATERVLRQRGAEPLVLPAIAIAPPSDPGPFRKAIARLSSYDVVVFTSANGVRAAFDELERVGRDARAFGQAVVATIGPKTAEPLARYGIRADIVAEDFRGEGLLESLLHAPSGRPGSKVLLARAEVARDFLPQKLREAGLSVDVVAAYRSEPSPRRHELRDALTTGVDAILFTSSSTVTQTVEAIGDQAPALLARTVVASIGPVTTATAERLGVHVHVTATSYTLDGLLEELERYFEEATPTASSRVLP